MYVQHQHQAADHAWHDPFIHVTDPGHLLVTTPKPHVSKLSTSWR